MSDLIGLSIGIYALAIAISFVIAATIKGIVLALPLLTRQQAPAPVAAPLQPAATVVPPEHVAAISAAIGAMLGDRHIVHIEDRGRGAVWSAEGRMLHQTSHSVSRGPKR